MLTINYYNDKFKYSIDQVNENSPAHQRLECGDVVLNIGNFSANDLRHEEALNLIRMFDLTLSLLVKRFVHFF